MSSTPGTIFKVEIDEFQLEKVDFRRRKCNDFLTLKNGAEEERDIAKLCGAKPKKTVWYTDDNQLYLRFSSDNQVHDRGFKLKVSSVEKPKSSVSFDSGM